MSARGWHASRPPSQARPRAAPGRGQPRGQTRAAAGSPGSSDGPGSRGLEQDAGRPLRCCRPFPGRGAGAAPGPSSAGGRPLQPPPSRVSGWSGLPCFQPAARSCPLPGLSPGPGIRGGGGRPSAASPPARSPVREGLGDPGTWAGGGAHMATGGPHVRSPAGKGVRVQSGWRVDQVAAEASWVQMCWACWEGTCATWASDGPRASLGRTCLVGFPIQLFIHLLSRVLPHCLYGLSQTVDVVEGK